MIQSRIHLVPDGDLGESAYDAAFAISKTLASEWNRQGKPKFDRHALIVLEKGCQEYNELRRFFLEKMKASAPTWVLWHELVEASYSKSDLLKYQILEFNVCGEAGLGGNAYGHVYDVSACEGCGVVTIHKQVQYPDRPH
jgi:hypothetical protein